MDAAAVERHHADVEAVPVEVGDKERPLALGTSGLQVAADEHNPRASVTRHRPATRARRRW